MRQRSDETTKRRLRALCVGECMVELTHVDDRTLRLDFAGDTYNAAVYLARTATELGVDVETAYLTGLGDDEYSDALRDAWRAELSAADPPPCPRPSEGLAT